MKYAKCWGDVWMKINTKLTYNSRSFNKHSARNKQEESDGTNEEI